MRQYHAQLVQLSLDGTAVVLVAPPGCEPEPEGWLPVARSWPSMIVIWKKYVETPVADGRASSEPAPETLPSPLPSQQIVR